MDNEEKNLGGRPRKEIDLDQLEQLCQIQCTLEEIAGFFRVSEDTVERRVKELTEGGFADFYKRHSQDGKVSLRRQQYKQAQSGNTTMLIWLGKQILNQKDRAEVDNNMNHSGNVSLNDVPASDEDFLEYLKNKKSNVSTSTES